MVYPTSSVFDRFHTIFAESLDFKYFYHNHKSQTLKCVFLQSQLHYAVPHAYTVHGYIHKLNISI